ncbi:cupin domain-containing protein [Rhodobacteraceae bacterium RKSG542]|uniref:cupin domain-containing protein n=1 Tax=Pseudovibrio flavus TaxID=2529854 RepID=UPI0012BD7A42|nr:cupin domain-containing protein [Pseudovibrio flavus]MTI16337.1 cupin domain-containing protein [Pseudovibrio flavus]
MNIRRFRPLITFSTLTLFAVILPLTASAAPCPPEQVGTNELTNAPTEGKDVRTEEIEATDLGNAPLFLEGRELRLRNIIIEPGGYVPVHGHTNRPALARVTQGELVEHTDQCLVPLTHKNGEVIIESAEVVHWVENKGDTTAILTVSDIVDRRGEETGNFK